MAHHLTQKDILFAVYYGMRGTDAKPRFHFFFRGRHVWPKTGKRTITVHVASNEIVEPHADGNGEL